MLSDCNIWKKKLHTSFSYSSLCLSDTWKTVLGKLSLQQCSANSFSTVWNKSFSLSNEPKHSCQATGQPNNKKEKNADKTIQPALIRVFIYLACCRPVIGPELALVTDNSKRTLSFNLQRKITASIYFKFTDWQTTTTVASPEKLPAYDQA